MNPRFKKDMHDLEQRLKGGRPITASDEDSFLARLGRAIWNTIIQVWANILYPVLILGASMMIAFAVVLCFMIYPLITIIFVAVIIFVLFVTYNMR
jgi:hypothetical protein